MRSMVVAVTYCCALIAVQPIATPHTPLKKSSTQSIVVRWLPKDCGQRGCCTEYERAPEPGYYCEDCADEHYDSYDSEFDSDDSEHDFDMY